MKAIIFFGVALAAESACLTDESEIGRARLETHLPIDNYQWRASHNTYEPDHTPPGKSIAWHFTESSGTSAVPANPTPTMHIELDIRDTMNPLFVPSGWDGTLDDNWWVSHGGSDFVTRNCGTVGRFTDCLNFIRTYHDDNLNHDFITVWIDKKQDWECFANNDSCRSPWEFDELIKARFDAATLYTPSDVLADGAGTIRQIINVPGSGWRSGDDLQGKIMFVLASDVGTVDVLGVSVPVGNERLEQYVANRGSAARAFVAPYASSSTHITGNPNGFSSTNAQWVVFYNLEWSSSTSNGACNSDFCRYIQYAINRHYLTRVFDLDDTEEYSAATDAGANFRPVDCPFCSGEQRFDCGCYP